MQSLLAPDYGLSYRAGNPVDWMHDGVCEQVDPDLFFEREDSPATANARLLCEDCPVRAVCRDYALRQPNLHGVWGGTTRSERWIMRRVYLTTEELDAVEAAERAIEEAEVVELPETDLVAA